jgi:hypothetical protein
MVDKTASERSSFLVFKWFFASQKREERDFSTRQQAALVEMTKWGAVEK